MKQRQWIPWPEIVEFIRVNHNGVMAVFLYFGHDGDNQCSFADHLQSRVAQEIYGRTKCRWESVNEKVVANTFIWPAKVADMSQGPMFRQRTDAAAGRDGGAVIKADMDHLAEGGAEDFKGHRLCKNCWNGYHFSKKGVHMCDGGGCQCPCIDMTREPKRRRIKRDLSMQTKIDTDDVIVFK